MITSRSQGLTVEQIRCIRLMPDEVLLVQVKVGTLPPSQAKAYINAIKDHLSPLFPKNEVLVTSDQVQFSVVQQP